MKQCTDSVLMVRPANFGFNIETAQNNAFQVNDQSLSISEIKAAAIREFDQLVSLLRSHDISVIVLDDTVEPVKTDAVFPNNWFSTHADGSVITYPMYSSNRRLERRLDLIEMLQERHIVDRSISYTHYENNEMILEGTGSMIIDRPNQKIYACISERTDRVLLSKCAKDMACEVVVFTANDSHQIPYYHTNVVMSIGEDVAIICLEAIESLSERSQVEQSLRNTHKEIIEISRDQVLHFCGNMLQVNSSNGIKNMIMSETAYQHLTRSQRNLLLKYCRPLYSPLSTIEKYGGGSARCMIAEIFLQKKSNVN